MGAIRIGVTMNVIKDKHGQEQLDSLSQSWVTFLNSSGFQLIPIPNLIDNTDQWIKDLDIGGIILSGGNNFSIEMGNVVEKGEDRYNYSQIAVNRDRLETKLIDFAIANDYPLLGVCRGMQLLQLYFEGKLVKVDDHIKTTHSIKVTDQWVHYFKDLQAPGSVNSYHQYGIKTGNCNNQCKVLATSDDGRYVELFHHGLLKLMGMMWHPERYPSASEDHFKLFRRFFK